VRYFASLLVRYENAVASHSLEFAAQNVMRYRLSATLLQPKLKGANVWPFNARGKVATG